MQQQASITALVLSAFSPVKIKSVWKILLPTCLWQTENSSQVKTDFFFFFKEKCCILKSEQSCLFIPPVQNLTWFDALNYTIKELKNSEQPKFGQMLGIGEVDKTRPKNTQVLMQMENFTLTEQLEPFHSSCEGLQGEACRKNYSTHLYGIQGA